MDQFEWSGAEALIASVALLLSVLSFGFTYWLDRRGHHREDRIEKSSAYLGLELASIEVFKYKAEHWDALEWGETGINPLDKPAAQSREEADAFFYQCLNLFEVASRFRKDGVIQPEIYASWVAWFYETLEYGYFRERWAAEYRDNYTTETRDIFDAGCALNWSGGSENLRREKFYATTGQIVGCEEIARWRGEVPEERNQANALRDHAGCTLAWHGSDLPAGEAADFAATVIGSQNSYISHGEIQTGLSRDGETWIGNLRDRFSRDFANDPDGETLLVRDRNGSIIGLLVLAWSPDGEARYATIEDMAIASEHRGEGLGRIMLDAAIERASASEADWVFLESGHANEDAHHFFEHNGFAKISSVFGKRIGAPMARE
ncbi:GNAT family N-acetyltransferase [Aurantiacibacter spongiae]|uniref:GNAT family N-acetyltransferase n=1 Tax=Aurantiacibacter spongiae TaxID=2488860 RepID=A0A3N5DCI1_9SPHN|nr:GNAT family N-acetyltransferase [Aurantiacibacter spongiae]RPF72518.1 GNAT family N-acetyltransferase [Aurantiacibacter spongiae]